MSDDRGETYEVVDSLYAQAEAARDRGDYNEAADLQELGDAILRRIGDKK